MRILILGGDGYIGWPAAMYFASRGYDVCVMDNYVQRDIAKATNSQDLFSNPDLNIRTELFDKNFGYKIGFEYGDCSEMTSLKKIARDFMPDTIIHFAEQASAPYSMMDYNAAEFTLKNNVLSTFN